MSDPATYDIRTAIQRIVAGELLSEADAAEAMNAIMDGVVTGAQIGAFVTALRMRGETVEEIAGFARAMRAHATKLPLDAADGTFVDTCGTGGDSAGTFNISTTASFVIAGAGVKVAKHGNRAVTSKSGSADVLEALGVAIELSPEGVARCVREAGIGFMFAPSFHPAMRYVGPSRREIGIRTVFNILGPLTNPAGAKHQLVGVGHPDIADKLASALAMLGSDHAVLVHAEIGLDELGLSGASRVTEYDRRTDTIRRYVITPEELGLAQAGIEELRGGDAAHNASITRSILSGELGPRRDVILLNAGAGLYAANAAESFSDGIDIAARAIDSGAALAALDQLVCVSQSAAAGVGA